MKPGAGIRHQQLVLTNGQHHASARDRVTGPIEELLRDDRNSVLERESERVHKDAG